MDGVRERHVDPEGRRLWAAFAVDPGAGPEVEVVQGEKAGSVRGDEPDGLGDVVHLGVVQREVEPDAGPARLHPVVTVEHALAEPGALVRADPEEPVSVRPRARAARPALDPEQVVQEDRHEAGVEDAAAPVADVERDDGEAMG